MTIHTALVVEQSPALRKLVTGSMKEAQSGCVIWADVDEDTFARFAQFVYTGDYVPAAHVLLEPEVPAPPVTEDDTNKVPQVDSPPPETIEEEKSLEVPVPNDGWGFVGLSPKKGKKSGNQAKKWKSTPLLPFHDRKYPLPTSSTCLKEKCKTRANTSELEDYTPVFLGHTRLYAFAEKYGIESLKSVVLHKLHETLHLFTPYEARYGDIVELLRDTYDKTPTRRRLEPLRELVTQYVASEAKKVINTEQCLSLIEEGGQLARDLFAMLLERLAT
ncbi:hypothetical protein MMC27_004455 [Xylographa pallens]|nr:hypothetical protein [Xylographa pallens]